MGADKAKASSCMKKAAAVVRDLYKKCKNDGACKEITEDKDGASIEDLDAGTKQIMKGVKAAIEKAAPGCTKQDIEDGEFKNKIRNFGKRVSERMTGRVKCRFNFDKANKLAT